MLQLAEVRDFFKTLENKADNYYIGRLENKKDKSIGFYNLRSDDMDIAIGGVENTKTKTKNISILIHWNKNYKETEQFSIDLYKEIQNLGVVDIGNYTASYFKLLTNEPIDVDSDKNGVYERVIEITIYYSEKGDK